MTTKIHPDVPNIDRSESAGRKLRRKKVATRKAERTEREKEGRGLKEQRPTTSAGSGKTEGRGRGDRSAIGREARPGETHDSSSREEVLIRIARLSEGDGAWVKRRNGRWTYAIVKGKGDGPNDSITFTVDKKGSTKKFPSAIWHKFLRAVDEKNNHSQRPVEQQAKKDEKSEAKSRCLQDDWDDLSLSSSSSYDVEEEFKEDGGNEVILQDNELSMYTLGQGEGPRSSVLNFVQEHELSMYTLVDADQQPANSPPVTQAWCRSGMEPISESAHCVGSCANAIDAPTEPVSASEVERIPCSSNSHLQNGPRLPQLKAVNLQALMTGEAFRINKNTDTESKRQYRPVTPPRNPQQERSDELKADRPIDEAEKEGGAEAEIHSADKKSSEANIPSGAKAFPRMPRRRSKSLPSMPPLPVFEQGESSKSSKRRLTRPRQKYRASWPANRREEPNGGKAARRDSGLVKQQSFNLALKSIHSGSLSSSSVTSDFAYY